jgi:cytochrome c-type biogenesis protein
MGMTPTVSVWLAFAAGLLSFLSPCTLPLFPSYLGYITGVSFHDLQQGADKLAAAARVRVFLHAVCFCIGLSALFVLLGLVSTAVGQLFLEYKTAVRLCGGVLVMGMGLVLAGVIRSDWLLRERRLHIPAVQPLGYLGSALIGVGFAAGWTPCVGPILSTVLILTATHPSVGVWYMVTYAIGFAVPFLLFALTLTSLRPFLRYTPVISRIGGWLMVVMGFLLVSGKLTFLTMWIQQTTGFTGVGL